MKVNLVLFDGKLICFWKVFWRRRRENWIVKSFKLITTINIFRIINCENAYKENSFLLSRNYLKNFVFTFLEFYLHTPNLSLQFFPLIVFPFMPHSWQSCFTFTSFPLLFGTAWRWWGFILTFPPYQHFWFRLIIF